MFAFNRFYTVVMLEDTSNDDGPCETTYPGCQPEEIEMPVVKFRRGNSVMIINTSSPRFVRADQEPV